MGPLLASYRPDLKPDVEDAALKFAELVELMNDRVDLFLLETVSSVQEAEGILRGTVGATKPAWLALSGMGKESAEWGIEKVGGAESTETVSAVAGV